MITHRWTIKDFIKTDSGNGGGGKNKKFSCPKCGHLFSLRRLNRDLKKLKKGVKWGETECLECGLGMCLLVWEKLGNSGKVAIDVMENVPPVNCFLTKEEIKNEYTEYKLARY